MAEHHRSQTTSSGSERAGLAHQIELGGTVYDAVGVATGTVHGIDSDRGRLTVDGRPVGFDQYEVPLSAVERVAGNEVHLNLVIDTRSSAGSGIRFTDPSGATPVWATTTAASTSSGATSPTTQRASDSQTWQPGTVGTPSWANRPDESTSGQHWLASPGIYMSTGTIAALVGAAAAGYILWRRTRRKSTLDRVMDFVGDRHPAWWGAAAASLLPVVLPMAYSYARRDDASMMDRARGRFGKSDRDGWLDAMPSLGLAGLLGAASERMPSADQIPFTRSSGPTDYLPSFDDVRESRLVMYGLPALALGVAVAALYAANQRSRAGHVTRVGDVMTHRPQVIRPDATIADAASMMRTLNVGSLPVVDGGRLTGMLTDRDIALRVAADSRDPQLTLVRDVMSNDVRWATEDDPIEEAARIMREQQIRRLPIVDDRHNLVGIVSLGDLATDVGDDRLSGRTLEDVSEPSRPRR